MPTFKFVDRWEENYEVEADTVERARGMAAERPAGLISEMAFMGTELLEEVRD